MIWGFFRLLVIDSIESRGSLLDASISIYFITGIDIVAWSITHMEDVTWLDKHHLNWISNLYVPDIYHGLAGVQNVCLKHRHSALQCALLSVGRFGYVNFSFGCACHFPFRRSTGIMCPLINARSAMVIICIHSWHSLASICSFLWVNFSLISYWR